MGVMITRNLLAGKTTLDAIRGRRHNVFVCIPSGRKAAVVSEILPEERIYDLGWKTNLKRIFQQSLLRDASQQRRYGFVLVVPRQYLTSLVVTEIPTHGQKSIPRYFVGYGKINTAKLLARTRRTGTK
jgi:hypothetical protein